MSDTEDGKNLLVQNENHNNGSGTNAHQPGYAEEVVVVNLEEVVLQQEVDTDDIVHVQQVVYKQEQEADNSQELEAENVQELEAENENQNEGDQQIEENDNIKKRGKYVRKNFLPNGAISIQRRTGKARTDAYAARSRSLLRNCQNLYSITGAEVSIIIQPTWPQGKAKMYESPGFQADPGLEGKAIWGMKDPQAQRVDQPSTSTAQQALERRKKSRSRSRPKKKRKHSKHHKRRRRSRSPDSSDSSDSESESSPSSSSSSSSDSEYYRKKKKRKMKRRKKKIKKEKKQQKLEKKRNKRKQVHEVYTSSSLSSEDDYR